MAMKELLLNYNDRSEVVFPPGPKNNSGTCDFMTAQCAKECRLEQNAFQKSTYEKFKQMDAVDIARTIKEEANGKLIEWFVTGDCPVKLTDKISKVIELLHGVGFSQHGFTRNRQLWRNVSLHHARLFLTVESKTEAIALPGLVTVPQYESWRSELFFDGERLYACGGGTMTCGSGFVEDIAEENIYPEDCVLCCENQRGCYRKAA